MALMLWPERQNDKSVKTTKCKQKNVVVFINQNLPFSGENVVISTHFDPQRLCPFWLAPRIVTSGKVQHQKSAINRLSVTLCMPKVKSNQSDCLRIWNNYSDHVQKIGPSQRSQFLVMIKKTAASGDDNDFYQAMSDILHCNTINHHSQCNKWEQQKPNLLLLY